MDAKKLSAQEAVESGDTSQLFNFAVELSREAARHVPVARVSFGKLETPQSEKEFLLWHCFCCLNELEKRSAEFKLSTAEGMAIREARLALANVA